MAFYQTKLWGQNPNGIIASVEIRIIVDFLYHKIARSFCSEWRYQYTLVATGDRDTENDMSDLDPFGSYLLYMKVIKFGHYWMLEKLIFYTAAQWSGD